MKEERIGKIKRGSKRKVRKAGRKQLHKKRKHGTIN
jgi:hypothetical protein